MSNRLTRVNELLKREIAEDIMRLQPPEFSMASVTVTRVDVSPNLRSATVFVSVFNEDEETTTAIVRYLNKNRANIQKMVCSRVKLKYTAKLSFKGDTSLVEGDSVLNLLADMEDSQPEVFGKKEKKDEDKDGV
ncbi:30S ribosome-binding factor RbfA [Verrucomicrobiota bacterium]